MEAQSRPVRNGTRELGQRRGVALDLLLQRRLGPVGDRPAVARGHVDELLGEVELELQVLDRDVLEDQRDVAADRVVVGGVGRGPVGLLEEIGDSAPGAREGDLEANALGNHALVRAGA